MAIYSIALNTTVTTTGAACADLKAAATVSPRIMEISISLQTAAISSYAFGRAGNSPLTQTAPVLTVPDDPGAPAGTSGSAVAWSPTAPTAPTNWLRRVSVPSAIGAGIIWTFPRGIVVAVSANMLLWNLTLNSASMNYWFVEDE